MNANASAYHPICVDVRERLCVVIGGGVVAERKVASLVDGGAKVRLISPILTSKLSWLAQNHRVSVERRDYHPGDLRGAWLVYAASDRQDVNEAVFAEATKARVFVNVVDQPKLCTFIAPAQVKRGDVTLAVSTGGNSPALAKRIRKQLQHEYGPEYGLLARLLGRLRPVVQERVKEPAARKRIFDRLVGDDMLEMLRCNEAARAWQRALKLVSTSADQPAKPKRETAGNGAPRKRSKVRAVTGKQSRDVHE